MQWSSVPYPIRNRISPDGRYRWTGWPSTWLSDAEFLDHQDKARSFTAVGVGFDDWRNLTGGDRPYRAHVGVVCKARLMRFESRRSWGGCSRRKKTIAAGRAWP